MLRLARLRWLPRLHELQQRQFRSLGSSVPARPNVPPHSASDCRRLSPAGVLMAHDNKLLAIRHYIVLVISRCVTSCFGFCHAVPCCLMLCHACSLGSPECSAPWQRTWSLTKTERRWHNGDILDILVPQPALIQPEPTLFWLPAAEPRRNMGLELLGTSQPESQAPLAASTPYIVQVPGPSHGIPSASAVPVAKS